MKLLFYNNFDMRQAWQNWKDRTGPDQHLYGANYLADEGIDVKILRHKTGWVRQASRYGNLDQQTRVALQGFAYPVAYCGFFSDTRFLALLRNLRLIRTDLISILHNPLERNESNENAIREHWKISVLSGSLHAETISTWPEFKEKFAYIPWGADLRFYPEPDCAPKPEGYIVSVGATRRDFKTLAQAAKRSNRQFVICTPGESGLAKGELPQNVTLHEKSFMSYTKTLKLYENSQAVAIPLDTPADYRGTQIGLSSLIEAMAIGKPVIMTHHPLIDIDIEAEGIGYWARSQDADSWEAAIEKITCDPKRAAAMGQRARRLCEEKYNSARYGRDLNQLFSGHRKFAA